MLFNPDWSKTETKADPFKLETLIAWLEKQPADQEYNFRDCSGRCLFGQYYTAMGFDWQKEYLADHFDHINIAGLEPHTFGAALERARALRLAND